MERKPRAAEGAGRLVREGKGNPFRRVPLPDASFKPLRFRPASAERLAQPDRASACSCRAAKSWRRTSSRSITLLRPASYCFSMISLLRVSSFTRSVLAARALRLMRFPARASRVSVKAFRTLPT